MIHQATRLRIMAVLVRNREVSFTRLRDALELTDGNLASHAATLEKGGYLRSRRALVGTAFEVRYRVTPEGAAAFETYTRELLALLEPVRPDAPSRPSAAPATIKPDGR